MQPLGAETGCGRFHCCCMTERAGELLLVARGNGGKHLRGSGVFDLLRNSLVLHLLPCCFLRLQKYMQMRLNRFFGFYIRITVFFGVQVKKCIMKEKTTYVALDYKLHFWGKFTKSETKKRHFILRGKL